MASGGCKRATSAPHSSTPEQCLGGPWLIRHGTKVTTEPCVAEQAYERGLLLPRNGRGARWSPVALALTVVTVLCLNVWGPASHNAPGFAFVAPIVAPRPTLSHTIHRLPHAARGAPPAPSPNPHFQWFTPSPRSRSSLTTSAEGPSSDGPTGLEAEAVLKVVQPHLSLVMAVAALCVAFRLAFRHTRRSPQWLIATVGSECDVESSAPPDPPDRVVETFLFAPRTREFLETVDVFSIWDPEAFIRELLSNASTANEKLQIVSKAQPTAAEPRISFHTDPFNKTLTIEDTGIGMSKEDLIALRAINNDSRVGFHTAFEAGKTVQIFTRAQIDGSPGFLWESSGDYGFTITEVEGVAPGTKIVIHLKDSAEGWATRAKVKQSLRRYCKFIEHSIFVDGECLYRPNVEWQAAVVPEAERPPATSGSLAVTTLLLGLMVLVAVASGGLVFSSTLQQIEAGIATMLLGGVAVQLSLFYLVNNSDNEIRGYSWEIISSTLTIFVSILVFRSIDGVFEYCLLGGSALSFRAAFYAVVSMAWIWILQVALYYSAGAQQRAAEAKAADLQPKADDASDQGDTVAKAITLADNIQKKRIQAKGFSLLLSSMAGFSFLKAYGAIQLLPVFATGPLHSLLVVPIALLGSMLIHTLTALIRRWVTGLDGVRSQFQAIWYENVRFAENEALALTLAFLIMRSTCFAVSGYFPGLEEELHTSSQSLQLVLWSMCWTLPLVTCSKIRSSLPAWQQGSLLERAVAVGQSVSTLVFAWLLKNAVSWQWQLLPYPVLSFGVLASVAEALITSVGAIVLIFALNKVAGASPEVNRAVVSVILSFGVVVGFAWGAAFGAGITTIAQVVSTQYQKLLELLVALFLASIVVPAWISYILPEALALQEAIEAEEKPPDDLQDLPWWQRP